MRCIYRKESSRFRLQLRLSYKWSQRNYKWLLSRSKKRYFLYKGLRRRVQILSRTIWSMLCTLSVNSKSLWHCVCVFLCQFVTNWLTKFTIWCYNNNRGSCSEKNQVNSVTYMKGSGITMKPKKLLSVLLTFIMVASAVPTAVSAGCYLKEDVVSKLGNDSIYHATRTDLIDESI